MYHDALEFYSNGTIVLLTDLEGNGPAIACDPNQKARGAGAFSSRRGGVDLVVECQGG
jgi:hypothetical protein